MPKSTMQGSTVKKQLLASDNDQVTLGQVMLDRIIANSAVLHGIFLHRQIHVITKPPLHGMAGHWQAGSHIVEIHLWSLLTLPSTRISPLRQALLARVAVGKCSEKSSATA